MIGHFAPALQGRVMERGACEIEAGGNGIDVPATLEQLIHGRDVPPGRRINQRIVDNLPAVATNLWRNIVAKEKIKSIERRGLVPKNLEALERRMLDIRLVSSQEEIMDLWDDLWPYFEEISDTWVFCCSPASARRIIPASRCSTVCPWAL